MGRCAKRVPVDEGAPRRARARPVLCLRMPRGDLCRIEPGCRERGLDSAENPAGDGLEPAETVRRRRRRRRSTCPGPGAPRAPRRSLRNRAELQRARARFGPESPAGDRLDPAEIVATRIRRRMAGKPRRPKRSSELERSPLDGDAPQTVAASLHLPGSASSARAATISAESSRAAESALDSAEIPAADRSIRQRGLDESQTRRRARESPRALRARAATISAESK